MSLANRNNHGRSSNAFFTGRCYVKFELQTCSGTLHTILAGSLHYGKDLTVNIDECSVPKCSCQHDRVGFPLQAGQWITFRVYISSAYVLRCHLLSSIPQGISGHPNDPFNARDLFSLTPHIMEKTLKDLLLCFVDLFGSHGKPSFSRSI